MTKRDKATAVPVWMIGSGRQIYKKITVELIRDLSDNLLEWTVWDHLWIRVGTQGKRLFTVLSKLPPGYWIIYWTWTMDGEIGNGGFNQYFFNGYGEHTQEHLEALKHMRAFKHRQILKEAIKIHNREKANEELQRLYTERTLESFSATYGMTALGACDKRWYALDDEFHALHVRFIRRHPELFVTG